MRIGKPLSFITPTAWANLESVPWRLIVTTLNETIQPDRKQVNTVNADFLAGKVYVDNSFQRRSVWVLKNKISLIETILMGFPMPEIYLWSSKPDPQTGATKLSIVDGQQRLTAIRDFIANAFSLHRDHLENADEAYRDKKFSELPISLKERVWEYHITTRTIPSSTSREEIVRMFLRLNETDKSLNPQELRNAEFNGEFINNVERIADLDFWKNYDIFRPSVIRRMGDLQFVSSLLIFLRSGVETEVTQKAINRMYDTYNEVYNEKDADYTASVKILGEISEIFALNSTVAKFFKSNVHLYPLFVVISERVLSNATIDYRAAAERLSEFSEGYQAAVLEEPIRSYRLAATEGTQKRANREERINRLRDWLFGSK
jgi:uncharacterized protein with ParB-like and HNH nuclease domain